MLYTQQFQIPVSGVHRIGTIGGSAMVKTDSGEMQVGFMLPCRYGLIRVRPIGTNQAEIFECIMNVSGYNDNVVRNCRVPGEVIVELPCSVDIIGPPSTALIIEAWDMVASNSRGACDSFIGDQTGIPIPPWATAVDFTGNLLVFRDNLGAIVGAIDYAINASIVGFSIPRGASTVDITGINSARTTLVFRQQ